MSDPQFKAQVEQLIRDNQVLLFMKGTPDAPQCGFSMRVVGVLSALREVTGEISDWQTFPQLYVNGELLGGCDIVEEMFESGELAELVGVEQPKDATAPEPEKLVPGGPQTSPPMQLG